MKGRLPQKKMRRKWPSAVYIYVVREKKNEAHVPRRGAFLKSDRTGGGADAGGSAAFVFPSYSEAHTDY